MYIGKALKVCVSGFNRQSVVDGSREYCHKNGFYILNNVYRKFHLFKWAWEYKIDLFKPTDDQCAFDAKFDKVLKEEVSKAAEVKSIN